MVENLRYLHAPVTILEAAAELYTLFPRKAHALS